MADRANGSTDRTRLMSTSTDPKFQAALALHRFGLGPKPGSIAAIASDPRGALLAELDRPGVALVSDGSLMTAAKSSMTAFMFRQERMAERIAKEAKQAEQAAMTPNMANAPAPVQAASNDKLVPVKPDPKAASTADTKVDKQPPEPNVQQRIFRNEARAH